MFCLLFTGPALDVLDPQKMFEVVREDWSDITAHTNSTACDTDAVNATAACPRGAVAAPETTVIASTFDAFVDAVLEVLPSLNLPVVTAEIGDTWIWGVQVRYTVH